MIFHHCSSFGCFFFLFSPTDFWTSLVQSGAATPTFYPGRPCTAAGVTAPPARPCAGSGRAPGPAAGSSMWAQAMRCRAPCWRQPVARPQPIVTTTALPKPTLLLCGERAVHVELARGEGRARGAERFRSSGLRPQRPRPRAAANHPTPPVCGAPHGICHQVHHVSLFFISPQPSSMISQICSFWQSSIVLISSFFINFIIFIMQGRVFIVSLPSNFIMLHDSSSFASSFHDFSSSFTSYVITFTVCAMFHHISSYSIFSAFFILAHEFSATFIMSHHVSPFSSWTTMLMNFHPRRHYFFLDAI